jgi:guanylate kinase
MTNQRDGQLVIISGPSGVGKSTICRRLVQEYNNVCLSVSVTTRPKADNEVEGRDYFFLSPDEFQKRIEQGRFLEYAEVFGNMYGTLKENVDKAVAEGKTVILEIDVQGALQVKEKYPDAKMIFILPPTQKDLVERMNGRGRDDEETAKIRLQGADNEIAAAWQYYNNMVINDDLAAAVSEVAQIAGLNKEKK